MVSGCLVGPLRRLAATEPVDFLRVRSVYRVLADDQIRGLGMVFD